MSRSISFIAGAAALTLACIAPPAFSQSGQTSPAHTPDQPQTATPAPAQETPAGAADEVKKIQSSATVFDEIMATPDKAIPDAILERAEAVAVFPGVLRAGFVFGGEVGHGIISVRNRSTNSWSPPAFMKLTGGSWGAQIGGQSVDVILVVMNQKGVDHLLSSQFTLGGQASAAAGPVGRSAAAATDASMNAEILSYSRSRGLFAGITLNGSSVREDSGANERYYGKPLHTRDIVMTGSAAPSPTATTGGTTASGNAALTVPPSAAVWETTLAKYFGRPRR